MSNEVRHCSLRTLITAAVLFLAFVCGGRLRALDARAMRAMIIVEGEEGRGSAFVLKNGGHHYLVTNSHVVRGNRNVKFKNLHNLEMTTGPLEIADRVDAVRAEIKPVPDALELEPQMDDLKIGDEVVVAGNSEGEGVVREISGKIVGVGPDRIEVDAQFVPGNSGSPILLKSTGRVIGLATYMKIPFGARSGSKNPFSLNEVRRFGYRLDTVAKWVHPQGDNRLFMEGLKLSEMEGLMTAFGRVFISGSEYVAKSGGISFVSKEKAQQFKAYSALSLAIDEYAKQQSTASGADDKSKNATAFFTKLKSLASDDIQGLKENQFSGYYAVQLKESLEHFQRFFEWNDSTAMAAFREEWLTSRLGNSQVTITRPSGPPVDPAKFKLTLSDRVESTEPPDHCHHVGYPPEAKPANLENLFWVIVSPQGDQRPIEMRRTNVRVSTPVAGLYHVYVEYRSPATTRVVSNTIDVNFAGVATTPATPAPAANNSSTPSTPPAPAAEHGKMFLLSKENAPLWRHTSGEWKIEDGMLSGAGSSRTDFDIHFPPPFTVEFKIKVIDGMRPRVKFGGITCGNEGFALTLALYPPGRGEGFFTYEHNRSYDVSLNVKKDKVEMYIDNQLIATGPGPAKDIQSLEFSSGDKWSKGATEFRDITVTR